MLERTIIGLGLAVLLVAGLALAADPPVPPARDAEGAVPADRNPPDGTTSEQPQPRPARAAARASASATATARSGSAGTDCAADASATVERDGERITVERSQRSQDGATGCHAASRARAGDTTRD